MIFKLCIWTPIPSPHQKFFFEELAQRSDVDLVVCYYEPFPKERLELGWKEEHSQKFTEKFNNINPQAALLDITDWQNSIHIIPGISSVYMQKVHSLLLDNGCKWIHWSERSGMVLADKLNYHMEVFHLLSWLYKLKYYNYAKQINRSALGVFAIGELAKKNFINWGVQENKIDYLYYTIDDTFNKLDIEKFSGANNFLFVGSLIKVKGIRILLKAFSLLKNRQDWRLILIGTGKEQEHYKQYCQEIGIEQQIEFLGAKPIHSIRAYMQNASVFILPSLFDGWGAVLNEAASVGKPLISTDECGAALHLIHDRVNGFRVKAGNINQLTNAMQFYIDSPHIIEEHGQKSYEIYQNYTVEKNVQRFIASLSKWQSVATVTQ